MILIFHSHISFSKFSCWILFYLDLVGGFLSQTAVRSQMTFLLKWCPNLPTNVTFSPFSVRLEREKDISGLERIPRFERIVCVLTGATTRGCQTSLSRRVRTWRCTPPTSGSSTTTWLCWTSSAAKTWDLLRLYENLRWSSNTLPATFVKSYLEYFQLAVWHPWKSRTFLKHVFCGLCSDESAMCQPGSETLPAETSAEDPAVPAAAHRYPHLDSSSQFCSWVPGTSQCSFNSHEECRAKSVLLLFL